MKLKHHYNPISHLSQRKGNKVGIYGQMMTALPKLIVKEAC